MSEKKTFTDHIVNVLPGLVISVVTSIIVFSGSFSALNAKVDTNSQEIKKFVPREEHNQIYDAQKRRDSQLDSRLENIEKRIEQIYIIMINKK